MCRRNHVTHSYWRRKGLVQESKALLEFALANEREPGVPPKPPPPLKTHSNGGMSIRLRACMCTRLSVYLPFCLSVYLPLSTSWTLSRPLSPLHLLDLAGLSSVVCLLQFLGDGHLRETQKSTSEVEAVATVPASVACHANKAPKAFAQRGADMAADTHEPSPPSGPGLP